MQLVVHFPTRLPYRSPWKKVALILMILFALYLWTVTIVYAQSPACGNGDIGGAVFRDYNANGTRDALEPGLGGVIVTAYDANNHQVAQTTTSSTGASDTGRYRLPGLTPPVRLEFTGLPSYIQEGVFGSDAGTLVQFVNAPTCNANLGVNNPAQYCSANAAPKLAVACYAFGEQNNNPDGVNKNADVMVSFPYTAGSPDLTNEPAVRAPLATHIAKAQEIGAVWGLAWRPQEQALYAAAFMKRHAGFGPYGPGAIYRLTDSGITLFHDFGALAGADPHPQPGQTCLSPGHNANNTNANCWLNDSNSFDQVGKVGFGGLGFSDDFKALYTVNLANRTLMAIPLADPNAFTATPVPLPSSCAAADVRPFAVSVNDGVVYVGLVCSAESTQNPLLLRAYVYAYTNGAFASTPTLDFSLNYSRNATNLQWKYWLNRTTFNKNDALQAGGKWGQPWLTSITFDRGDMILGLRDRNGDLFGSVAGGPDPADPTNYSGLARGDILRACANGVGGWTLEANGSCGALTTAGANNQMGPGGGEYYFQDLQLNPLHNEVSFGAQLQIPGFPDVVSVIHNPIENLNAVSDGGIKWYNNQTGTTTRGYLVFDASGNPALFQKANGLGDLEALCDPAPLEIGNRVWNDSNGNGIQDAGEPGIDGVTVELYRDNLLVGSTTTNNSGQYYFNNTNVNQNGAFGIVPGTGTAGGASAYEIRIPNATGANQQPTLTGFHLTQALADLSPTGFLRDANGGADGANAVYAIPYTALANVGDNNHSYDFGFTAAAPPPEVIDLEIVKTVTPKTYLLGTETNVTFVFTVTNHGPLDVTQANVVDNQPANVTFTSWACAIGAPGIGNVINACGTASGNGNLATTVTLNNGATAIFTINATIGNTAMGTVINSASESLPAGFTQNPAQNLPDQSSAQVTPVTPTPTLAALGDYVWLDTNRNGLQDAGEPPVAGVTVTLSSGVGIRLATATTTANGLYHFIDLNPGDYTVCFTLPAGKEFTQSKQGNDPTRDSDADPISGCTSKITLTAGQNDLTWDAGLVTPVVVTSALGGCTWDDGKTGQADGIRQPNEKLLVGVTAILLDATGHELRRTITNANGCYIFENLPPGSYVVSFLLPTGYSAFTITQSGSNGNDANPINGQTVTIALPPGVRDLTWDAGFIIQPSALPPGQEPQVQQRIFLPWTRR